MNKTKFYANCPKTRVEFLDKFRTDNRFRNEARIQGFAVIGETVVFPNGMVAGVNVK